MRGICEVRSSVSYDPLSSCFSCTRKSSGSSCLVLSCHIGLVWTVWDSPVKQKRIEYMKPKFYFNGAWVYMQQLIRAFQFTMSKQNNHKINTNLKPIHEYHFSLDQQCKWRTYSLLLNVLTPLHYSHDKISILRQEL